MSDPVSLISYLSGLAASIYFYKKRSLRYLQYFQQEEYTNGRFVSWFWQKRAFDTRGSQLAAFAAGVFALFGAALPGLPLINLAIAVALVFLCRAEENPLTTGKIKLKLTARALRIYRLAFGLFAFLFLSCAWLLYQSIGVQYQMLSCFWALELVLCQATPIWLLIANFLLDPYEQGLQEGFANEARALLKQYGPTVIGITGSYGKTSTKVILKDVLGAAAPTFSTPKSINSYMGVTREIRERLKPGDRYAVIEMGAYYLGSIARMCSLTPPQAGIITAIGIAHLERFGGRDQVMKAKSELAQAIPSDGILVVNGDDERCRQIAGENKKKVTLLYGLDRSKSDLDACLYDITTGPTGSTFKIAWQGQVYEGTAPLLGKPMLSNLLACFTMAMALGVAPDVVLAAMRTVKTESNRLELLPGNINGLVSREPGEARAPERQGQILRLNDAYNSNPVGFGAALEVLASLPGGRKILVTPGMIELGDEQALQNRQLAAQAAPICDLVLVVGDTNKDALADGLIAGGASAERYKFFAGMKDALVYLQDEYCQDGDVVLIENDLPDLYEGDVKF